MKYTTELIALALFAILPACQGGGAGGGSETLPDAGGGTTDPLGPQIISFDSNTARISQDTVVRFTAIVTDPDGINDVIGGALKSPEGDSYGAFQTSASEGAYEISLTWTELNTLQAIAPLSLGDASQRNFIAEFYDQAGHVSTAVATIELQCSGQGEGVCDSDGSCVDMLTSDEHCGSCGTSTKSSTVCRGGEVECYNGSRDTSCEQWILSNFNQDASPWCEDTCQVQVTPQDQGLSCDQACQSASSVCVGAYGTYTENDFLYGQCDWIWAQNNVYGQLVTFVCTCAPQ